MRGFHRLSLSGAGTVFVSSLMVSFVAGGARATAGQLEGRDVTFSRDIAPILFASCATCHRPGGSAPFSLLTYQDARIRATQLAAVTAARVMPPWQPEPGHGEFAGSRRLSDVEIHLIGEWQRQGAVEGDPATLPPVPQWTTDWELGEPDLVLTMPRYELRADGPDVFRNIVIPAGLDGTRYIRAWEFRPGNARVVHHATMQIDPTESSRRLDERDPAPGYEGVVAFSARAPDGFFLDWAPGHRPARAVEGTAWPLTGASALVLMLHMRPSGKPESVQASLGLYFSETPPPRLPVMLRLTRQDLDIPPGERAYAVTDSYTVPVDVVVHTVQPHAHYLGREMKSVAYLPDGGVVPLIHIKNWNFDWQDVYHYARPLLLPAGTRVVMSFTYDNSIDNVRNPSRPPQRVTYGQQTTDEMAELWFQVVTRQEPDRPALVKDLYAKVLQEEITGRRVMVSRDPDNSVLRDDLLVMLTEVGDLAGAAEEAAQSLRLQPTSPAARYNLGAAQLALGRSEEARAQFEETLRLDPSHEMASFSLALVLGPAERTVAIEHLRRALRTKPAWPAAQAALAWHLAQAPADAHEQAESLELAQQAVEATASRDPALLAVLATAQAGGGQFERSAETLRRALALYSDGADDAQVRNLRSRLAELEREIGARVR